MGKKISQFLATYHTQILLRGIAIFLSYMTWGYLFHPGCIIQGDIDFGFSNTNYLDRLAPLWNERRSTNNFFNLPRILLTGPVHLFAEFLDPGKCLTIKILIFLLFTFGVVSKAQLIRYIIQTFQIQVGTKKISDSYIVLIAVIGGCIYMYCPYSIHRIHHFYLLFGYALFPRALLYYWKYLHIGLFDTENGLKVSKKNLLYSCFALLIASGGIHYMFYGLIFSCVCAGLLTIKNLIAKNRQQAKIVVYLQTIRVCCFLTMFSFWLLPFLYAKTLGDFTPKNINVYDTIAMFSRNASVEGVLKSDGYRRPLIQEDNIFTISGISHSKNMLGWSFLWGVSIIGFIRLCMYRKTLGYTLLAISIALLIFSTGTYYPIFAKFYIRLIFHAPGAGLLGPIFRDPNKFVGLLFLCMGIIASIGVYVIVYHVSYISRIHNIIWKKTNEMTRDFRQVIIAELLVFFAVIAGMFLCYGPYIIANQTTMYNLVQEPKSFTQARPYLEQYTGSILLMPRFERVSSPGIGFTQTTWNTGSDPLGLSKPTGSADIYSFNTNKTFHPLEGNINGIGFMYDFLEEILKKNMIRNFGLRMQYIGFSHMMLHNDIVGYSGVVDAMQTTLATQHDLISHEITTGMTLFMPGKINTLAQNSGFLYNFGGYRDMLGLFESLIRIDQIHTIKPNVFVQESSIQLPEYNSDYILVDNKHDFDVSMSSGEMLGFSDSIQSSNPATMWAKSRTDMPDRMYYIRKLYMENYNWGLDYDKGIAYTFSPSKINIPVYYPLQRYGDTYFDARNYDDISQFFNVGDDMNESNIRLVLDKKEIQQQFNAVKGSISQGDSRIRRLGLMKPLPAKEKNGYSFRLQISGKNVNKIHMKVKFFDINFHEVGVGYLSAPEHVTDMDKLLLEGSFITPEKTTFMMVQMSSLENPKDQSYWWIHDLVIKDLSQYMIENSLTIQSQKSYTGAIDIYARVFMNTNGGTVKFTINNSIYAFIDTKTKQKNAWERVKIISLPSIKKPTITASNIRGFNALNVAKFIEHRGSPYYGHPQMIYNEAEYNMEHTTNVQSERYYPYAINGKTINGRTGKVYDSFDILSGGYYDLTTLGNSHANELGIILMTLNNEQHQTISSGWIISNESNQFKNIYLSSGSYLLEYNLATQEPSLISTEDITTLDKVKDLQNEGIYIKEDIADTEKRKKFAVFQPAFNTLDHYQNTQTGSIHNLEDEKGCSYYYEWEIDKDVHMEYEQNTTKIEFATGYGCSWLITSHPKIAITGDKEYLVNFDITKINTKKLHVKIQYFDEQFNVIPSSGLVIEKDQLIANHLVDFDFLIPDGVSQHIEHIITTPDNARYMKFEIRQKQRQDYPSTTILKNLKIYDYTQLPGIDSYLIQPSNVVKNSKKSIVFDKVFSALRVHTDKNSKAKICNGYLLCFSQIKNLGSDYIRYLGNKFVYIGYMLCFVMIVFLLYRIQKEKPH